MTTALIIIGLLFSIAGVIGSVLPIIPGPILGFLSLIIISYSKSWEPFSVTFLVIMGCLTAVISVLDYIVPAAGAKKFGASKLGILGSVVGMIVGFFVIPPWGMLVGAFLGAIAGELIEGKDGKDALRAGWGVFVGNIMGACIKLAFTITVLILYIKAMF